MSCSGGDAAGAAQRSNGVSLLWPLLALVDDDNAPNTSSSSASAGPGFPADIAERLLSHELDDKETKRALRLVSRATRSVIDARVRTISVRDPCASTNLARFQGLEVVAADSFGGTDDNVLPLLTRGLPSLQRLKKLRLSIGGDDPETRKHRAMVAEFARAMPTTLEGLNIQIWEDLPGFGAIVKAAASLPALRSVKVEAEDLDHIPKLYAALHRTLRLDGAWQGLRELRLWMVDATTYAALARAGLHLPSLRKLELSDCLPTEPPTQSQLADDGGLRLLAPAPLIRQLTELQLAGDHTGASFDGLELPRLEALRLTDFRLSPTGLPTAKLPALLSLELYLVNSSSVAGMQAIAAAPWYAGLSELTMYLWQADAGVRRALLSAPFRALSKMWVHCPELEDIKAIASSPALRQSLRSLTLEVFGGSEEQWVSCWDALARAPFEALRELNVESLCVAEACKACKEAIGGAAWASQLQVLNIS